MGSFWQRDRSGRLGWTSLHLWCRRGDLTSPNFPLLCLLITSYIDSSTISVVYTYKFTLYLINILHLTICALCSVSLRTRSKLPYRETMSGPALFARWQRLMRTETMQRSWPLSVWLSKQMPWTPHLRDQLIPGSISVDGWMEMWWQPGKRKRWFI